MVYIRIIFFILFFSIGTVSLSISVLCEDLIQYYRNRQLTRQAEQSLEKLKTLNSDYDDLLSTLAEDPNYIKRIAPAAIGLENQDANAINPRVEAEQLAAARRALTDPQMAPAEPVIPRWLGRCSEPAKRMTIFFSGVALILISFICFGPAKKIN
jgi:cell division protein FtsL